MFRSLIKISAAVLFLLLLIVPVTFYRAGQRGALLEAAVVVALFAVTASWGHRWIRSVLKIESPPISLDARILTGLAFVGAYSIFAMLQVLGTSAFVILGVLQSPFLLGLFASSQRPREAGAWEPGFWRKRKYVPAMALMAAAAAVLTIAFWSRLRWWSLLMLPAFLLGDGLAELVGRSVRRWVLALEEVWKVVRLMGPPVGGFALGYLILSFVFAGLFSSVWRADSMAFKGLPTHPHFTDFAYYSVMTISTTGYGDISPQSALAKMLASAEALIGLTWTIVVFAAVLTVVQKRFRPQKCEDEP
jgi:hypothetical protein